MPVHRLNCRYKVSPAARLIAAAEESMNASSYVERLWLVVCSKWLHVCRNSYASLCSFLHYRRSYLQPGAASSTANPQTATIIGTVLDVTGATVPNAHVVLQGPDERRTFVTGDNGFFSFEKVKAGTPVRVEVSAPDLKNWSSNEIILQPGQSFIVTDISLGVADVETAVSATTPEEVAVEQVKIQEQQRVFGVVPNFYVTYQHDAAPLTPKLKFQLAMKALTDPVTIAGFGMNAAIYQAAGYPSYRPGRSWLR